MSIHRTAIRTCVLLTAALALVAPAAAQPDGRPPAAPRIPVTTPAPVPFELALDEVELHWRGLGKGRRPPVASTAGVAGATLTAQQGERAVITLAGIGSMAELRRIATALEAANPGAVVEPVLYEAASPRSGATRRIGTRVVRLTLEPGAGPEPVLGASLAGRARPVGERADEYLLEASEPLAALELTATLQGRKNVTSAALSAIPGRVLQKLERRLAGGPVLSPFDAPEEAQEFFALKRQPVGQTAIPADRYQRAIEQMKQMSLRSTRTGVEVPPATTDAGLAVVTRALGTWTPLGPGNVGGRTRALVVDPNGTTMYAGGVAGGVWKSTDGGASWTPTSDLLANLAVNSLAMDPTNSVVLYAGTGEGYFNGDAVRGNGIYITTNAAASWTQLPSTATADFRFVNKIVVSPNATSRLYAATRTGIFRSPDNGGSWTKVLDTTSVGGCTDLVIRTDQATDYMFAACGAGSTAHGTVYRNTDAGDAGTWTGVLSEAEMARTSLAIARSNQSVVYALAASNAPTGNFAFGGLHAVFRSIDGGATWPARVRNTSATKLNTALLSNTVFAFNSECFGTTSQFLNQGWYDNVIAVDPADSNRVWVGGIDLFRSDDGGANWGMASHWWASAANPRFVHADQHAIVFHPGYDGTTNKIMIVGNDGGIFRTLDARAATATGPSAPCSTNNGSVNWATLNHGYAVTQFYHGVPYPGGATYFGGTQDNGTVRGTDGGGPNAWTGLLSGDGGYVAVDPTNTNVLYAEEQHLDIRKSINGGASFVSAITGITEPDSNFLFIVPFVMDPSNAQRLWTGGFTMWRTTNGAGNWVQASADLCGDGKVSAIAVAPTNPSRVLSGMSDGCINRTTAGLTSTSATAWASTQPAGTTGAFVSWLAFDPTNEMVAYATYSTFGVPHVWKSVDGGATWSPINGSGATGIPDVPVHTIAIDPANPTRLFVGTDVGVFSSSDGGATWAVEHTGFANVITEALAVGNAGGTPSLFAFTHGRGAWRVPTAAVSSQLTVTAGVNAPAFSTGQVLQTTIGIDNPGLPLSIDRYVGLLLPDGHTIIFITGTGISIGNLFDINSFQPFATGVSLVSPFNVSVPLFSYGFTGIEPTGTFVFFQLAFQAGAKTNLVGIGLSPFTVSH